MSSTHVRIELTPKAGFCIKSATLNPALLPPPPPTASNASPSLLEPAPQPIPVPKGQKVFVNLAWDPNVPPPPDGSEEEIQRAMQGEDADEANPSAWYVPVIVSNARQDKDKSGNAALVFDCIFNSTVKSRTLRDPEFKIFLVELSLQRIEAQTGLELSRNIGTPNIASKGKLLPRAVQIPAHMVPALVGAPSTSHPQQPGGSSANGNAPASASTPLIQELSSSPSSTSTPSTIITPASAPSLSSSTKSTTSGSGPASTLPGLKGILKKPSAAASSSSSSAPSTNLPPPITPAPARGGSARLDWSWTKEEASGRLRIDVRIPGLTPALIHTSTLDIEPNRLVLSVPAHPPLDIDTNLSDAEIVARIAAAYASSSSSSSSSASVSRTTGKSTTKVTASATALKSPAAADDDDEDPKDKETMRVLTLKRQRDFAVDDADAVWAVGSGTVSIFV